MDNSLILVRESDSQNQRLEGIRQYRCFTLWVNGILIDTFRDDSQAHRYASGTYLDEYLMSIIQVWQNALRCKVTYAERKDRLKLISKSERFPRAITQEEENRRRAANGRVRTPVFGSPINSD